MFKNFYAEAGIICVLFQYIIFKIYGDLTSYFNMSFIIESFSGIKPMFATGETLFEFIKIIFCFFIANKLIFFLNGKVYHLIGIVITAFWSYIAIRSIVFSEYKIESLILFAIPCFYLTVFIINYKLIHKEEIKKKVL